MLQQKVQGFQIAYISGRLKNTDKQTLMKQKMVYILLAIVLLVALWALVKTIRDKDRKASVTSLQKKNNELFLSDIDFADGSYVLYVKHKEFGTFAVTNEEILKENSDALKVSISWANYLPGEGDRSYGVMLFKDNQLLKTKKGGVFKNFEIGTLKEESVAVKEHRYEGVKRKIQNKMDSLRENKNVYITFQSDLPKENKEFHFRIYFPDIAVPVTRAKDPTGYERITTINGMDHNEWQRGNDKGFHASWVAQIENCIKNKAGEITDFDLSISNGTRQDTFIVDLTKDGKRELRNANNGVLYMKDFMYYQYQAYIGADKEDAEKLLAMDYSDCIDEHGRKRPAVIKKMEDVVKQSTMPNLSVEKGEVGLMDFRDTVTKSKSLYEQEYQLNWLEIENRPAAHQGGYR